jgi:hypothetical protein
VIVGSSPPAGGCANAAAARNTLLASDDRDTERMSTDLLDRLIVDCCIRED